MLTFTVTPALTLGPEEKLTNAKLNTLGQPLIATAGAAGADQIADRAIGDTKTTPGAHWYAAAAGFAANTYQVDFAPAVTALVDGLEIAFAADAACTAAPLLDLNDLGAKALVKLYDTALEPGDVVAGQIVVARYNAALAKWQVLTPLATSRRVGLVNHWEGLRLVYLSAATLSLHVEPGGASALLNDDTFNFVQFTAPNATSVSSALYTLNTATVGLNGRDKATAVEMAGWNYLYLVSDGTQTGLMASTSMVKPAAAGGFTPLYWCRVGVVNNAAGTALRKWTQQGRWFALAAHLITTAPIVVDAGTIGTYASYTSILDVTSDWLGFLPPIARAWRGVMGISENYGTGSSAAYLALAATADGLGEQVMIGSATASLANFATHFEGLAVPFTLPVYSSTAFYFKSLRPGAADVEYAITGVAYEI